MVDLSPSSDPVQPCIRPLLSHLDLQKNLMKSAGLRSQLERFYPTFQSSSKLGVGADVLSDVRVRSSISGGQAGSPGRIWSCGCRSRFSEGGLECSSHLGSPGQQIMDEV